MAFPPQHREPAPALPSIIVPPPGDRYRSHASHHELPFGRSPAMSIPGIQATDNVPPPLPPPRYIPGPDQPPHPEDRRDNREHAHGYFASGYGSMNSLYHEDRPSYQRRSTTGDRDEGSASYTSTDSSRESIPTGFGLSSRLNASPNEVLNLADLPLPRTTSPDSTYSTYSRPHSRASSYGSIDSGVSHPPRAGNKRKKRVITWSEFAGQAAPHQYASSAPNGNSFLSSPNSASMERSNSNSSITSVKSTASSLERRAKEAREWILHASKVIMLAPKPNDEVKANANAAAAMKEAKVPVNKSNYERPKHPKVYCDQCTEHPDGFRGDHELRRHVNAKHEGFVKKFVCRDPATVGIESKVKAVNPLSKCKACISGKMYGAHYNAAAHLRRTHFKPKTSRGKKGGNVDEKCGRKGGGYWPPMSELKAWFVEKKVRVHLNESPDADQDDVDADMDAETESAGMPAQMEMFSGIGSSLSPFDLEANYDLNVEGAGDPAMMAGVNGDRGIPAPISSASGSLGYSPSSDGSPIVGLADNYAFSEHASAYGYNLSSTNAITPTTFQDMLALTENLWTA